MSIKQVANRKILKTKAQQTNTQYIRICSIILFDLSEYNYLKLTAVVVSQ